jgi:MFS family permease
MTERVAAKLPRAYWRIWWASGISNLGDGIFLVALPLLAARLTRSEVSISLIAAVTALPWLLLSLPIGAIIDRSDRKRIMIRADLFRAAVIGALALAVAFDVAQIWMLWVMGFAIGVAEVFFDNASQALLPAVVPDSLLQQANGRRYSVELVANIFIGTPLGSVLFAVAVALPFGVEAASFVLAVLLIAPLRGDFHPNPTRHETASLYAEMRTGLRWLWRNPLLRTIAVSLALTNLALEIPQAVFVLFAQDTLGISETGYGFLIGVMGAGAVLGGLLGDRIVGKLGQATSIYAALVVWVVCLTAIGVYPRPWSVALAVSIQSMAATVWNVVMVSLRQQVIPAELFGRVNSVYRWFAWGTMPIGALIGGQVAHHVGLRANYVVAAAVMVAAIVVALPNVSTASIVRALTGDRRSNPDDDTPVRTSTDWFDDV